MSNYNGLFFLFIIVTKCLRQQRQIALWVKYFAYKNEDLSSDPRNPHQKPGVIVNACKSSAGEAGTGRSLGGMDRRVPGEAETGPWECWPFCLIGKIKFSKRLYARKAGGGAGEIAWGSRALAALT